MNRRATIKDVATEAGTSYATVSRVFNGRYGVNERTRERVLEAAKMLGYQPSAIARSLVRQQSETLALLIPDITNPYFADIAFAVSECAAEYNYNVMLFNTNWDGLQEQRKLDDIVKTRPGGIIIKASNDRLGVDYSSMGVPVVMLNEHDTLPFVNCEDYLGGRFAAEHLISRGYRRIAFIGGRDDAFSTHERIRGFMDVLNKHNMNADKAMIMQGGQEGFSLTCGYEAAMGLLSRTGAARPDAAFCANDVVALGALYAAAEVGLSVPNDFGVVGFDDISFAGLPQIELTTIRQPRKVIGEEAVRLIMASIECYPEPLINKRKYVTPDLVIRKTTR